jgi:hypothetical protein
VPNLILVLRGVIKRILIHIIYPEFNTIDAGRGLFPPTDLNRGGIPCGAEALVVEVIEVFERAPEAEAGYNDSEIGDSHLFPSFRTALRGWCTGAATTRRDSRSGTPCREEPEMRIEAYA